MWLTSYKYHQFTHLKTVQAFFATYKLLLIVDLNTGAVEMSKAALYFANAAKKVTMQPVVNEVLNERARIRQLQTEIDGLRSQLVLFLINAAQE